MILWLNFADMGLYPMKHCASLLTGGLQDVTLLQDLQETVVEMPEPCPCFAENAQEPQNEAISKLYRWQQQRHFIGCDLLL